MSLSKDYSEKTSPLIPGGEVNLSGITYESTVDGEGVRIVLFFSGCRHNCPGCQNPQTHRFDAGIPFTAEIQHQVIDYVGRNQYIGGVTLSGGDPMFSADHIVPFVSMFGQIFPNLDVWVYSGFTYEQILEDHHMTELLSLCDVLVDGPFVDSQKDSYLLFRGSANQRIIDVKASIAMNKIVPWVPRIPAGWEE